MFGRSKPGYHQVQKDACTPGGSDKKTDDPPPCELETVKAGPYLPPSISPSDKAISSERGPANARFASTEDEPVGDTEDCPSRLYCPQCKIRVTSNVQIESTLRTFVIAICLFVLLGWISICVIPFAWTLLQTSGHYCPNCGELICTKQRIRFSTIRNEVVTVKLGNCAVVLSRKYVIGLCFMTSIIVLIYAIRWYITNVGVEDVPKGPLIDSTWDEFLKDCGVRTSFGNSIRAVEKFEKDYRFKTVNWKGTLNRISEGIFSKNFIMIDMHPSQFQSASMPDIALILKPQFHEVAKELEPGDWVAFETTLLEMGRRGKPHYGVLWNLKKSEADRLRMPTPGMLSLLEPLGILNHLMNSGPQLGRLGNLPLNQGGIVMISHGPGGGSRIMQFGDESNSSDRVVVREPDQVGVVQPKDETYSLDGEHSSGSVNASPEDERVVKPEIPPNGPKEQGGSS